MNAMNACSYLRPVQPGGRRLLHQRVAGLQGAHLERAGPAGRRLERRQRHGHRGVLHPGWPGVVPMLHVVTLAPDHYQLSNFMSNLSVS